MIKTRNIESESRHQCLIYEGPPSQKLPALAATMRNKLSEGFRCLYLNSAPMVTGIRSYLSAIGVDVASETGKGGLIFSSEPTPPGAFGFDPDSMLNKLEEALNQALNDGYVGLFATGDMAWEFGHVQNLTKLVEYEWKLEELFRKRSEICGICQYHRDTLPPEAIRQGVLTHRSIFITETISQINPSYVQSQLPKINDNELDEIIKALIKRDDTKG